MVYGIDLGSAYSAIAFVDEEVRARVVSNVEGDRITASAVFVEPDAVAGKRSVVVGKVAKELASTDPDHFIDFVKPHMGDVAWKREIEGITWTPEKVSAAILRKLVQGVECCGEKVQDVVITCPAGFSSAQRQATITAGKLAGLNVVGLIDETTATALVYARNNSPEAKTAVVYNLGGQSFDVAVVKVCGGKVEVVSSGGSLHLGGKDWDDVVARHLAEKFAAEKNVVEADLLNDQETFTCLRIKAECVKMAFSHHSTFVQKIWHGNISAQVEIDRDKFEELTKPLLDKTEKITHEVMSLAQEKGVTRFDAFLLEGGAARLPQVWKMVEESFGTLIERASIRWMGAESVVKGAAIYGTSIASHNGSDVNPDEDINGVMATGVLTPEQIEESKQLICDLGVE
jgi:molecular chaperone DnaK (HSP70)